MKFSPQHYERTQGLLLRLSFQEDQHLSSKVASGLLGPPGVICVPLWTNNTSGSLGLRIHPVMAVWWPQTTQSSPDWKLIPFSHPVPPSSVPGIGKSQNPPQSHILDQGSIVVKGKGPRPHPLSQTPSLLALST